MTTLSSFNPTSFGVDDLKAWFARLADPHEDPESAQEGITKLYWDLVNDRETTHQDQLRFSPFAQKCLDAGIVCSMMTIARREWIGICAPNAIYVSQFRAVQSLSMLMEIGDLAQRGALLDQLLEEDVVGLCLHYLARQLYIFRFCAAHTLHDLALSVHMGERLPPSVAADVIEAICIYALRGPEYAIEQMLDPATAWQASLFIRKENLSQLPPNVSSVMIPGVHTTAQSVSMAAAQGILCTFPPRPCEFCLNILKKKPHIIDLLLDCASLDRPPWCPESEVGKYACEVLDLLFRWPSHIVPGVLSSDWTSEGRDRKLMLQMTTILVSRPHWADRLIEVWMRLDEEDVENAERTFSGPMVRYRRLEKLDPKHLKQILESRGVIRIVILRLMATVTYFAEPCGVTNTHIESFLHLAYVGSHNLRVRLDDCHTREETMTALEHGVELLQFSSAISGSASGQDVPYAVAPAFTMAPTTLVGLLVVLAQRKTLNGVQTLRKAPSGLSPSTSLDHIQQITHPDIIRRIIKISHQRLHARMIAGNYRAKEPSDTKDTLTACVVFVSIAELAAALVALDMHTEGRYASDIRPARKVLVLSLGGASRMAFGVGNYLQALHFGRGAVKAAEGIPDEEGLDLGAIRSIKLLIDQANVEIYESA